MLRLLYVMAGLAFALASAGVAGTDAAEAPKSRERVLFVVDSTSDMGVLFGGSRKLAAASNALASVLPNYADTLDTGLLVYGHRYSGQAACGDVDRVRPISSLANTSIGDLFASMKTKGDAPLAAALAAAAAGKDIRDGKTAIVVIAGGPESCHADPCEVAGKIGEEHALPIYVVAIDAGGEADQLRPLKCIADNTKGGFWQVGSTMELAAALDDALALIVKQGAVDQPQAMGGAATQAPADSIAGTGTNAGDTGSEPPVESVTAPAAGKEGKVSLTALLADAGPQLDTGLVWRVFVAAGGAKGPMKLVTTSADPTPSLVLPTGDYYVNVAYGRAYLTRKLTIGEGSRQEQFVLNAGGLKIGAKLADGSLAPVQLVTSDVYSDERDQFGNRMKLLSGMKTGVVIRLNAGLYHLATTYGDANATVQTDVGVEAGKITDAMFTLTGSKVTFRLVQQNGGEALTGTSWTIIGAGGETVAHSLAALPTRILAAGTYGVTAERGGKTYTQDFTVKAGEPLQVELLAKTE